MSAALFNVDSVFESLQHNGVLLTSNRRLAAHCQTAYALACSQRGLKVWPAPAIFPLDDWLQNLWIQLTEQDSVAVRGRELLRPFAETLLWERVIRNDPDSLLLKTTATARQAQAAYRTLQLWETHTTAEFHQHPDCQRFIGWMSAFEQQCQAGHYLSSARLPQLLHEAFQAQELARAEQLVFTGFQHIPAALQRLFQSAAEQVTRYRSEVASSSARRVACQDATEELQAAAQWARGRLTSQPDQRIAIIVPDLAQQRAQVEYTLTAAFEPQYLLPETPRYQLPFNISAGVPLAQTPLIDSALNLLTLLSPELGHQTLYALLHSPFVDTGLDQDEAVILEMRLRETGKPAFSLKALSHVLETGAPHSPFAGFAEKLATVKALQHPHQHRKKNHLSAWLALFRALLDCFDWPAQRRRLDSIEYQQLMRWQSLLQELSALSAVCGAISLQNALGLLQRLVAESDFQAQSAASPVQVLGLLEASGLSFDAMWIVGVNDQQWPAPAKPNPFIPINLQRSLQMPHASAERELAFARELLADYLTHNREVVISYAHQSEDQALRPSTLIEPLEVTDLETLGISLVAYPHPYYRLRGTQSLQLCQDNRGPALTVQADQVSGGSAILMDQAACPFRAFAIHRLGARALPVPTHHVTPAQRGTVLHAALEQLWSDFETQQRLLGLSDSERLKRVQSAVENALQPLVSARLDLFGEVYRHAEIQRLVGLLERWLGLEKQRPPFSVAATEKTVQINLNGLPLSLRIDRIDRLDNHALMLIDYKTSLCSAAKWQGERPEEPQLPLYSVTLSQTSQDEDTATAVAFAQINVDRMGLVGLAARDGVAEGVNTLDGSRGWDEYDSWESLQSHWRSALMLLADEFLSGHAPVTPRQASTCQFCHLSSLCRINQLAQNEVLHDAGD